MESGEFDFQQNESHTLKVLQIQKLMLTQPVRVDTRDSLKLFSNAPAAAGGL